MHHNANFLIIILCAGIINLVLGGTQKEMTIFVDNGNTECFYESAKVGNVIDLEYQVIDGDHGNVDVSFVMYDSTGQIVASDYKKTDNIHRHEVKMDGDHRFCFDNTFSMFNRKTVFFEVIVESNEDENKPDEWGPEILDGLTPEEFVDMKVYKLKMTYIMYISSNECHTNFVHLQYPPENLASIYLYF